MGYSEFGFVWETTKLVGVLWMALFPPSVYIKNSAFCGYLLIMKAKVLVCIIVMLKRRRLLLVVVSLWQCQCTSFSSPSHITWLSQGKRENISAERWKPGLSFCPSVDCTAKHTWSFTLDFNSQLASLWQKNPLSLPLSILLTQMWAWGLVGYRVGGKTFPKSDFWKWTHVEIYWL